MDHLNMESPPGQARPKLTRRTWVSFIKRPSLLASSRAIGIVAEEVFPYLWMFVYTFSGDMQVGCQGLNDPDIGLVRDNKAKVIYGKAVVLKRLPGNFGHTANRLLEKPVSIHLQMKGPFTPLSVPQIMHGLSVFFSCLIVLLAFLFFHALFLDIQDYHKKSSSYHLQIHEKPATAFILYRRIYNGDQIGRRRSD